MMRNAQNDKPMCVVVLFGGMSSEHEVSRVSAGTFVRNLDRTKYEVLTVGITKEGRWLMTQGILPGSSSQLPSAIWAALASVYSQRPSFALCALPHATLWLMFSDSLCAIEP